MQSPQAFDVQEAVERCLALLAKMPDGEVTTTARLLDIAYEGDGPDDDADLFDINHALFERSHEVGVDLDNSFYGLSLVGLPFNLEFEIKHI